MEVGKIKQLTPTSPLPQLISAGYVDGPGGVIKREGPSANNPFPASQQPEYSSRYLSINEGG
jgi:hypothetical protein